MLSRQYRTPLHPAKPTPLYPPGDPSHMPDRVAGLVGDVLDGSGPTRQCRLDRSIAFVGSLPLRDRLDALGQKGEVGLVPARHHDAAVGIGPVLLAQRFFVLGLARRAVHPRDIIIAAMIGVIACRLIPPPAGGTSQHP